MHLVQLDSSTRDYNGTSYYFNVPTLKKELEICSILSIKAWEDEASFLTFLAVHFSPHRPIFIRCQERDTNVTYYFTCHHCHLPHREIEKHHCTYTSFSNKLWSRFSSRSCIHMRMNVYCEYNSVTYAGAAI